MKRAYKNIFKSENRSKRVTSNAVKILNYNEMKLKKYILGSWMLILLFGFNACDSFLEEDNYSAITAESFITEDNADNLVVSVYQALRGVYKNYNQNLLGTDIITQKGEFFSINKLNEYYDMSSSSAGSSWGGNYKVISYANTAINRYSNEISWDDLNLDEKSYGIAQAKALRALAYYNLVQQYGGVVLELEETSSIRIDYERSTEEETFNQIIEDLEAAIPDLKDNADFGRFSKRAAQHLLADVYVTRGYKSFGSSNDFTTAAGLAESAIGSYDIRTQTYAQVFSFDNQENDEVLFSVQFGNGLNYDDRNNNKHTILMNGVIDYIGIGRNNPYGRSDFGGMPTEFFYSLFADNDTREAATLHRVLYATEAKVFSSSVGEDIISVGDTIVYYPKHPLSETELADKLNRYWVYNPDQYYYGTPDNVPGVIYQYTTNVNRTNFPIFKKFDDEGFDEAEGGYRDTYVFRVAESHLIAAEAYLEAGNDTKAMEHINRVRERATGETAYYTSLTIDDILNERAIELAGEESRWSILKRTGKLEERINSYNPHVIDHGRFDANVHLVRPLPTGEMELTDGSLIQNPGY